jgi:hypothetical protein
MKPYHFYTFAEHEISFVNMSFEYQPTQHIKPRGLWFSLGDEWIKFLQTNLKGRTEEYNYLYELKVDMNEMFVINNMDDLHHFTKCFKSPGDTYTRKDSDTKELIHISNYIDWQKFARITGKNGIIINPNFKKVYHTYNEYQPYRLFFKNVEWYLTWDIASGAIWNATSIQDIKLIYKKEVGKSIPYSEK